MPNTNRTFILAPFASGLAVEIVLTDKLELNPPPIDCTGGWSSVVPSILTLQGGDVGGVVEAQVPGSITGPTPTSDEEVIGRRSAIPDPAGNVEMESILSLNRVMGTPVLLVILYLRSNVPRALGGGPGVSVTTIFGDANEPTVWSRREITTVALLETGLVKFSGPGAPNLWWLPLFIVPVVSSYSKSAALSWVS